jgi:hypothetical protein
LQAAAESSDVLARHIFSWPASFGTALVQNTTGLREKILPLTDGLFSRAVENQHVEIRVDCRTLATLSWMNHSTKKSTLNFSGGDP